MLTALTDGLIFTGDETISGKAVLIEDGVIKDIISKDAIPYEAVITECRDSFIAPGLIDLQIAGGGGYLFSDNPTPGALRAITDSIVKSGTTGFLIALPTNSMDLYHEAVRVIKENPHPAILGLHLEGPFISKQRAGAHSKEYIRSPQDKDIRDLLSEADGIIKMMTVAPEVCDPSIIRLLNDYGVTVAAGHSNATYNEAVSGFKNGVSTVTHLFNAMSPVHHRDPGLPGAAFMTEDVYASIIADGIHVDFNMVSLSKMIMKERLFLVSDAVEESSRGAYLHVRQKDRFTLPDGTLSGSALTMLKAVENCVNHANITLEEALRMASYYPSKLLKLSDRGKIARGNRADLIVFNREFIVKAVCVNGVFLKP